jgi:hypothetical protein
LFIGVEGRGAVRVLVDEIIVQFVTLPHLPPIPLSSHFLQSRKSLHLALSFGQVSRIASHCNEAQLSDSFEHYYHCDMSSPLVSTVLPAVMTLENNSLLIYNLFSLS